MLAEVVTTSEALVAEQAGEFLFPGVSADMALQLIRAGETLATEEPVADKGALSSMPPQMSLEVRGLPVDLSTAWDVAAVDGLLPQAGC